MRSRFKTFGEFTKQIKIAYRTGEGKQGLVIAYRKDVIFKHDYKPWNSEATKKTFIAKLYIKNVLVPRPLSNRIARIEKYELLGKRCMFNDYLHIICDAEGVVNTATGEVGTRILIYDPVLNTFKKVLTTEVQL